MPAISCSKASSMAVRRDNAGVSGTSAVGWCLLPWGRPGRRDGADGFCCLAAALALLAAFSAALRTTCSTRIGKARRAWTLTSEQAKKAKPGIGFPYRLEKQRSSP
jgi:hypothetical protein